MINVAVVGIGYRFDYFYNEIKKRNINIICGYARSEKSREKALKYNIKLVDDIKDIIKYKPDFVINTTSKDSNFEISNLFLENNIKVLQETPVAVTNYGIDLLSKYGNNLQIAEQYQFYNYFKKIKLLINKLGDIEEIRISYLHDYHMISIIRYLLGPLEKDTIFKGIAFKSFITHTKTRYDDFKDGIIKEYKTKNINFMWNNTRIYYDFNSEEYRSTIRNPYLIIRGSRGEIINDKLVYLDDANEAKHIFLDEFGIYDDTYPVGEVLDRMVKYALGGIPLYPYLYALEDAKISIIMNSFDENYKEIEYRR